MWLYLPVPILLLTMLIGAILLVRGQRNGLKASVGTGEILMGLGLYSIPVLYCEGRSRPDVLSLNPYVPSSSDILLFGLAMIASGVLLGLGLMHTMFWAPGPGRSRR